tara:strand:- start:137 stop:406 length:270 start_codon:yes stop_codon:yes gene_type:complete
MAEKIKSIDTGKEICYELQTITMPLREEFVDAFNEAESAKPQKFSLWVNCVRIITKLSDDELLKLTDQDIYQIVLECMIKVNNKKKVKK